MYRLRGLLQIPASRGSSFTSTINLRAKNTSVPCNLQPLVVRKLSTTNQHNPTAFTPSPPTALTFEMADGIQRANLLILKHGVGKQRLEVLAKDTDMPITLKWQNMMEVYLGAQLHVVASLGYPTNEQGIMLYTQQLASFISSCEPQVQEKFRNLGRDTWRGMLKTAFALDKAISKDGDEELSIVDARNIMHKVSSKLIEPDVLSTVATRCSQLAPEADIEVEMGNKHRIIQDVVVNTVYLGGSPSLVEELGFGSGPLGYAYMQYRMASHENDPLCVQYTTSAMMKIWQAAGLDLSQSPQAAKMPLSPTP